MIIAKVKIIKNTLLADNVYEMILEGAELAKSCVAGQFINVSTGDNALLLRRPISVCRIGENSITITFKVVGEGTKILAEKKVGELLDVVGGLGNGFPLVENKKTLLIGGGIGVPPMLELASSLAKLGNEVTVVVGFINKAQVIYEKELAQYGKLYIATDVGDYSFKGNVITLIEEKKIEADIVYACGPTRMLEAVDNKYNGNTSGYLSFEERFACGIGACYGCVCKTRFDNDYIRVCKEGPVFEIGSIKFD